MKIEKMKHMSYAKILRFWVPLAATWMMMAFEGPFLAAVIARLSEPKYNLAAYGISFSFALIIEAPVIMMLSASVALVTDHRSFMKLKRFTYALNASITSVMLICLVPSVFYRVAEDLIGLPEHIAHLTHTTCLILLPWPCAIGYRRFYQGVLIRYNLTRRVAYGTVIRLGTMTTTALILAGLKVEGAHLGGAALAAGVVFEAIASRMMVHGTVKKLYQAPSSLNENIIQPLTYSAIAAFYYPLALTSLLALGIHPIVTFSIGKSRFAIESLAVLPVVNSFVMFFRSLGMSYQEVGIALMGAENEGYTRLRNFAWILSLTITVCLCLVAFTPLSTLWYHRIAGLSSELTRFSYHPTQILVLQPGLAVWISFQQAILINGKFTGPIIRATAVEVFLIVAVLFSAIYFFDIIGAVAAALSYMVGRIGANLYLIPPCLRVCRKRMSKKFERISDTSL